MFYTIIITDAQAIFRYDSLTTATERFHTELAYAMNQNIACTCVVIDRHGTVYRSEEFTPVVEPAEEE